MDWSAAERAIAENTGLPQLIGTRRVAANPLHLDSVY
jgi:L,D-transpeptidase ErfK/SrfK